MSARRPRVAYFSPLAPEASGIADYSEELLPHLAKHWELDLFVSGYEPTGEAARAHRVFDCAQFDPVPRLADYDAVLYHLGNSNCHAYIYETLLKWPGLVVLHELAIHHLIASQILDRGHPQQYLEEMRANHGDEGVSRARRAIFGTEAAPWLEESLRYPMNRRVLDQATGILVHSAFAARAVQEAHADLCVRQVDLHAAPVPERAVERARPRGRSRDCRFVTAGNLTPTKRVDWALQAMAQLPADARFRYEIVGDLQLPWSVDERARDLDIAERVEVVGRVDAEHLYRSLLESDVGIFLRSPTLGETSAIAMRALSCGLPLVVSDAGWFHELPDDVAIKVPADASCVDRIRDVLAELIRDPARRHEMGDAAKRYALERDVASRAQAYHDFVLECGLFPRRWAGRTFQRVVSAMHEMDVVWAGAAARRTSALLLDLTEWSDPPDEDDEATIPADEGPPQGAPFATRREALR